jgi:hypothetical protein
VGVSLAYEAENGGRAGVGEAPALEEGEKERGFYILSDNSATLGRLRRVLGTAVILIIPCVQIFCCTVKRLLLVKLFQLKGLSIYRFSYSTPKKPHTLKLTSSKRV